MGSPHVGPTRSAPPRCAAGARRLDRLPGPLPRGRQRRGGPRPRRLPRPAAGRAGAERRRRRRPGRGARPAAAGADRGPDGPVLRAANTGAPLDAAGVQALATLRASAKRDDAAASAGSGSGSPRCSRSATRRPSSRPTGGGALQRRRAPAPAVAARPGAGRRAGPARRRGAGAAAALRRPTGAPPAGFATEVVLPLRAGAAGTPSPRRWPALDAELLLALPGLAAIEVVVDGARRRLPGDGAGGAGPAHRRRRGRRPGTWPRRSGELPAELLADRPVEERDRRGWTLTWAVPLDDDGAPRPLPGRQVRARAHPERRAADAAGAADRALPAGPDRRHVAPGPVTDALVARGGRRATPTS